MEEKIKAIRLVWDSLDSHLEPTHTKEKNKCCQKAIGSQSFHKKCCKEYALILKVLVDTL